MNPLKLVSNVKVDELWSWTLVPQINILNSKFRKEKDTEETF